MIYFYEMWMSLVVLLSEREEWIVGDTKETDEKCQLKMYPGTRVSNEVLFPAEN